MANESKVILAEKHRYLCHIMETTAGNAIIKTVLLVLLCVIKTVPKEHDRSLSVSYPPTRPGLLLPLTTFPVIIRNTKPELWHTHVPCT